MTDKAKAFTTDLSFVMDRTLQTLKAMDDMLAYLEKNNPTAFAGLPLPQLMRIAIERMNALVNDFVEKHAETQVTESVPQWIRITIEAAPVWPPDGHRAVVCTVNEEWHIAWMQEGKYFRTEHQTISLGDVDRYLILP